MWGTQCRPSRGVGPRVARATTQMTQQLVRLERQDVTGTNGRASAIRCEAAALRRDINEAQILIDRLQRRYLNDDGQAQPGRPARVRRR